MAIPLKRQMINIEQLRFPSGIAAAQTLRALHVKGSQSLRAASGFSKRAPARSQTYELIELVLFRALPGRDCKPLAKSLLAKFGSSPRSSPPHASG